MDHLILWNKVLDEIERKYDTDTFEEIFKDLKSYEIKNGYLVIICSSSFIKKRLNQYYLNEIDEIINKYSDQLIKAKICLKSELKIDSPFKNMPLKKRNLNANYNFNSFVVGQSNRFAYQMALKVADQPGMVVNPFYIFGSVGLGKTHLMQAIGNFILDNDVNRKVLYVKVTEFIEDYAKKCNGSLSEEEFNEKYRNLDILLIDDIQSLDLGPKSQREFFKIFDILYQDNKQIVITSDRPAKDLNIMERLISRFEEGLVVDIQTPSLDHRINIINRKFEESGYTNIDNQVLNYIADNFVNNIREIEGAVNRIVNYCGVYKLDINIENAKEALGFLVSQVNKHRGSNNDKYTEIIGIVADFYNISYDDIIGKKRNSEIVIARQIGMFILKNKYDLTFQSIGALFGNRDHTTVLSSVNKIEKEYKINNDLKLAVDTILKKVE